MVNVLVLSIAESVVDGPARRNSSELLLFLVLDDVWAIGATTAIVYST